MGHTGSFVTESKKWRPLTSIGWIAAQTVEASSIKLPGMAHKSFILGKSKSNKSKDFEPVNYNELKRMADENKDGS